MKRFPRLPLLLLGTMLLTSCFVARAEPTVTTAPLSPGATTFTEWHGYHYDAAHSGYNPNIPAARSWPRAWSSPRPRTTPSTG